VPYDPAVPPPPSLLRISPGIRTPYLTQASLAVERKLGKGSNYLSVDYTMVRGIKLYRMRNINAPLPGTGAPPDPTSSTSTSLNRREVAESQRDSLRSKLQLEREWTSWDSTRSQRPWTIPVECFPCLPTIMICVQNSGGLTMTVAPTQRHWYLSIAWRLPARSIVSLNSGVPYNITIGFDNNGDTVPNDRPLGVNRNTGKGPGYASVDLHFAKQITFSKQRSQRSATCGTRTSLTFISLERRKSKTGGLRLEVGIDAVQSSESRELQNYGWNLTCLNNWKQK